ncbi:MAG: hypothetical protein ACRDN8_10745 [Thermoleophilaceae bacterium]
MSLRGPRIVRVVFVALAALLAAAALAWACHPAASITVSPSTGAPGTPVTVTGKTFAPGETVHIGWGGANGTTLGRALVSPSGTFQSTVTIPDAPADTYTIVASAPAAPTAGSVTSFVIPGPAPAPRAGSEGGSPSSTPAREPSAPGNEPQGAHTTSGATSGGDGVGHRHRGQTVSSGRTVNGGGARGGGGASAGGAAAAAGEVATLPSGTSVFADSLASPRKAETRAGGKAAKSSAGSGVSQASAAGDLWSGFRSRAAAGVLGSTSSGADAPRSVPLLSTVLFGLGLMTVVVGLGVAGSRRRRMLARAGGGESSV